MATASYDPVTGEFLGLKRPLLAVYQDLNALTNAQKTAIWNALTAGSPPLWATTDGQDAGTVAALSVSAIDIPVSASFPASAQTAARLKMAAAYVRDNPRWLINPAFDPTINVPGFDPAS